MTKKLLFVVTIALVAAFALMAADVSGKWTFEQAGRQGGTPRQVTITLKADGAKLTGSVPGMGRGGADVPPSDITDGKVEGNKVSFSVTREFNGNKITQEYKGTVAGSDLKLNVTGGRGGPVDVVFKKQ